MAGRGQLLEAMEPVIVLLPVEEEAPSEMMAHSRPGSFCPDDPCLQDVNWDLWVGLSSLCLRG